MANNKKTVIIGAGITGLTAAYYLNKKGIETTILEKKNQPGGSMESVFENGYLFDRGPNSALETTHLIEELVNELNLNNEIIYANKIASKRYILKNNILHELPTSPSGLLKTKLFSFGAKLRLLGEPFVSKSKDGYYQSVANFVRRRLGDEFLDYAINPFVGGVYAGNPEELSVKSAFPLLYRLEEVYGGLLIGMIKGGKERKERKDKSKNFAKMFSFKNGMQTLPEAITEKLKDNFHFNTIINSIQKKENKFIINYTMNNYRDSMEADNLLITIPAYAAASLFREFDGTLVNHFESIIYPPVMSLFVVYKKSSIKRELDGFGFLIPEKEKKLFLGAIWSSTIFPGRCKEDEAAFTLFVGGARFPELANYGKEDLINKVLKEFEKLMIINESPVFVSNKVWSNAIPQYNIGYIEHENYFNEFEKNNPGIFLGGNYRGGIAVGDCIKNGFALAEKIEKHIMN